MARAAQRRDPPPPPAGKHRALGDNVAAISPTPRDDDPVLHEPRVHALLEKLRRSKKGFEPAADDVQRAVRRERRAREQAQNQIIAEPVEVAWRVQAPRAQQHLSLPGWQADPNQIQNPRVCCSKLLDGRPVARAAGHVIVPSSTGMSHR